MVLNMIIVELFLFLSGIFAQNVICGVDMNCSVNVDNKKKIF